MQDEEALPPGKAGPSLKDLFTDLRDSKTKYSTQDASDIPHDQVNGVLAELKRAFDYLSGETEAGLKHTWTRIRQIQKQHDEKAHIEIGVRILEQAPDLSVGLEAAARDFLAALINRDSSDKALEEKRREMRKQLMNGDASLWTALAKKLAGISSKTSAELVSEGIPEVASMNAEWLLQYSPDVSGRSAVPNLIAFVKKCNGSFAAFAEGYFDEALEPIADVMKAYPREKGESEYSAARENEFIARIKNEVRKLTAPGMPLHDDKAKSDGDADWGKYVQGSRGQEPGTDNPATAVR